MVAPVIMGLLSLAPALLKLFDGGSDSVKDQAVRAVSQVAQGIAGVDSDAAALAALQNKPELLLQFQQAESDAAVRIYEAETQRLQAVNATMQAEIQSGDPYVRRWRPTLGYIVAISFGIQMLGFLVLNGVVLVTVDAADQADVLAALADTFGSTVMIWNVALAVLGVGVWKRSDDKRIAAGQVGLLGAFAKRIAGG